MDFAQFSKKNPSAPSHFRLVQRGGGGAKKKQSVNPKKNRQLPTINTLSNGMGWGHKPWR